MATVTIPDHVAVGALYALWDTAAERQERRARCHKRARDHYDRGDYDGARRDQELASYFHRMSRRHLDHAETIHRQLRTIGLRMRP
jgi:hypothetical protein